MPTRSDTIRPLLPVLHLWRLLGVLPFARLDSSRVHVHVSPSSRFLCLVIVVAAGTAHVGREVWAFLRGEREIDLTRKVGIVMSLILGLHVALSFSKKSCRIMQSTFRCVNQCWAGRDMESSPLTPLRPVLQVARCLGLLPYSEVEGTGVRLKLRHSRTIHGLGLGAVTALCLAAGLCLYKNAARLLANLQSPSISSDVTEFIINCFSIVIAVTIVFFTRGSCELITKFLRYLAKVDTALMTTPGDPRRGLLHVLFGGVVWMARAAATIWLFSMPLCDALLYPLWFVILAAEQLTVVLCLELARRYRAINTVLQGMRPPRKQANTTRNIKIQELRADKLLEAKLAWLEPPPPPVQLDTPTTLTPARIEALREAHSSLADAFQELNSKLGVFLLIDLAYLFIVLLSTSISFLQHCIIKSTDQRGETSFCVGYSLLAMDGLVRMGIITVSCGSVGEEAERTAEAAARLLRRALDWDALRELQILGAQVRARRVAFWACGLFTVDRPLLFSICGAVTSYLFILSQLK